MMRKFILLFLLSAVAAETMAQGCSDAGFCTAGSLKHAAIGDSLQKNRISFLAAAGIGDENVLVFTPAMQYDLQVNDKISLQAKLSSNYASGDLGKRSGWGDIYFTGTYKHVLSTRWSGFANLGLKIPLAKADQTEDGRPLPMQYQSSLGTYDLILGYTIADRVWNFSVGYQQPLTRRNDNSFIPARWPGVPDAAKFPSTNRFERKPDLLLRVSRNFVSSKWVFNAGVLNIIHLGKDTWLDPAAQDQEKTITGSAGLTLNLTGGVWYQAGKRVRVGMVAGTPLVVRDVRPDGLTRKFVVSPEITIDF